MKGYLTKIVLVFTLALVSIVSLACSVQAPFYRMVKSSGQVTSETRSVSGFSGVDLQTIGALTLTIGKVDSAMVEADDNILLLQITEVLGGQLLISMCANTKISTRNPVHFIVTMKALENATLNRRKNVSLL